jgi:hypothetical protein
MRQSRQHAPASKGAGSLLSPMKYENLLNALLKQPNKSEIARSTEHLLTLTDDLQQIVRQFDVSPTSNAHLLQTQSLTR